MHVLNLLIALLAAYGTIEATCVRTRVMKKAYNQVQQLSQFFNAGLHVASRRNEGSVALVIPSISTPY